MSDLYGPALPPGFNSAQSRESEEKDTLTTSYGPMLPTSARTECPGGSVEVYGPVAPQPPSVDSKATDAAGLTYGPKLLEGGEIASTQTQSGENNSQPTEANEFFHSSVPMCGISV